MTPTTRAAGVSGILAGVGLAIEGAFWFASGWTPQTFADPASALAFLQSSGSTLRAAVFAGAFNLVFAVVLIVGLAGRLRERAPTAATATLYFGIIGTGAHGLVPIAHWLGVPKFTALTAADPAVARAAWAAFDAFLTAAGGLGSFFVGLSLLAVGWGAVSTRSLPVSLGWVGLVVGLATVSTVLTVGTPLAFVANAVYFPSLLLAIAFRVWAGVYLVRVRDETLVR